MRINKAGIRRSTVASISLLLLGGGLSLMACSGEQLGAVEAVKSQGASAGKLETAGDNTRTVQPVAVDGDDALRASLTVVYTNNLDGEIEPCG